MPTEIQSHRFRVRESPLTIGLRDVNHRATFSFFLAAAILTILTNILHYFLDPQVLHKDLSFFLRATEHLHIFYLQELVFLFGFTVVLLPATILYMRHKISGWMYGIPVFLLLVLVSFGPLYLVIAFGVHPALRVFFVLDQVRHWMRLISFVSENVTQVRDERAATQDRCHQQEGKEQDSLETGCLRQAEYPTLKSLMYFMFAPTLIYQHSYPRSPANEKIRWKYVLSHMLLLDLALIPIIIAVFRQLSDLCHEIGHQVMPVNHLIQLTFWSYVSGALMLTGIGYSYVHCWHNGQAEVMRFGDRGFYRNWWSAPDAFRWMSVWNMPVQRWLSEYVYKPCVHRIGSRVLTVVVIFLVSGLSHDYILSFTMGFTVPVFMCVFAVIVPSIPLILLTARYSHLLPFPSTNINTFAIYILAFGAVSMYSAIEYFSRLNCPPTTESLVTDFFVPRFLNCLQIESPSSK